MELTGFMINKMIIKTLPPNNCTYIRICLLMRNKNTDKNTKHTINTVVIWLIYVFAVFNSVGTKQLDMN